MLSYRPMFEFNNQPDAGNAQRFATKEEAEKSAEARCMVWTMPSGWRVEKSNDPVNYRRVNDIDEMV